MISNNNLMFNILCGSYNWTGIGLDFRLQTSGWIRICSLCLLFWNFWSNILETEFAWSIWNAPCNPHWDSDYLGTVFIANHQYTRGKPQNHPFQAPTKVTFKTQNPMVGMKILINKNTCQNYKYILLPWRMR